MGLWNSQICQRFIPEPFSDQPGCPTEVLNVSRADYDLILAKSTDWFYGQVVLFNHGVHVGSFRIGGLMHGYGVCVNLKKHLVDLPQ